MTVGELLVLLAEYPPETSVNIQGDGPATGVDWWVDFMDDSKTGIIINDYPTES